MGHHFKNLNVKKSLKWFEGRTEFSFSSAENVQKNTNDDLEVERSETKGFECWMEGLVKPAILGKILTSSWQTR